MQTRLAVLLAISACAPSQAEVTPLRKLPRAEQEQRIAGDLKAVSIYRQGLQAATAFTLQQTNLFPAAKSPDPPLPRRGEKEVLWQTWKSYLDYLLALDALDRFHREFYRLSGARRERSFIAGYAGFLAKYRFSLEFIEAAEKNPFLETILNEAVPEVGLPAGTYAKVKFRFLNVAAATDFVAQAVVYQTLRESPPDPLRKAIEADAQVILKMGRGKGEVLTANNALKVLQRTSKRAWFPVQAGVAEWMGDVKVYRTERSLVSPAQIEQLRTRLQPGDVLLERREWYLSNIGLPGFWPHAALYIGTPEERRHFFADPKVAAWVRAQGMRSGVLENLLQARYADAYAESLKPQEKNHSVRILEAMSEGVSFTTLEHSADADSVAVLRPLLPKSEKASAIVRAFHYAGRPYDFNFDFATDAELVCTELVFKAYEPAAGQQGLNLPLVEMLGRKVLPANEIARQFDEQSATAQAQFSLVAFLDGYERQGKAMEAGLAEFRQSWRRPKWHVLTQAAAK